MPPDGYPAFQYLQSVRVSCFDHCSVFGAVSEPLSGGPRWMRSLHSGCPSCSLRTRTRGAAAWTDLDRRTALRDLCRTGVDAPPPAPASRRPSGTRSTAPAPSEIPSISASRSCVRRFEAQSARTSSVPPVLRGADVPLASVLGARPQPARWPDRHQGQKGPGHGRGHRGASSPGDDLAERRDPVLPGQQRSSPLPAVVKWRLPHPGNEHEARRSGRLLFLTITIHADNIGRRLDREQS